MSRIWFIIGGRKFLVLVIGTVALLLGKLDSWHWVAVAGLYIGGNVIQKLSGWDGKKTDVKT